MNKSGRQGDSLQSLLRWSEAVQTAEVRACPTLSVRLSRCDAVFVVGDAFQKSSSLALSVRSNPPKIFCFRLDALDANEFRWKLRNPAHEKIRQRTIKPLPGIKKQIKSNQK